MPTVRTAVLVLGSLVLALPAVAAPAKITADCSQIDGKLKGLHGHFCDFFFTPYANQEKLRPLLQEAGVSFLRLGISGNPFRGMTLVDASNPDMYDFSQIDREFLPVHQAGIEILAIIYIMAPSSFPNGPFDGHPQDMEIAKEVVRRTVMHLNDGWANGHKMGIQYWEVANEPDLHMFDQSNGWTLEGYCRTYAAAAEAVKSVSNDALSLKVGGPALADGLSEFGKSFLEWCKEHNLPLDFYSFHGYNDDPGAIAGAVNAIANQVRSFPEFVETELILDEWNVGLVSDWEKWAKESAAQKPEDTASFTLKFITDLIGSPRYHEPYTAIHNARTLMLLERSPLDKGGRFLLTDDGKVTMGMITCPDSWTTLLSPAGKPAGLPEDPAYVRQPAFYAIKAFDMLYQTPQLAKVEIDGDGIDAMVGVAEMQVNALLINSGEAREISFEMLQLPDGAEGAWRWEQHVFVETAADGLKLSGQGEFTGARYAATFPMPARSIVLLRASR